MTCLLCGALLAFTPEELERVERYRLSANTEMLCVMFADISGFSGISSHSLSMSQRILAIHTALATAVVERDRAGEIVNTAGDGLLAVFSNPATAVERALELHAAIHHYHQGLITDGYLADALRAAGLALHPSVGDEEFQIHIGLHVGLVTRGGRTSRDVFGHNVNVACRLCDLADRGQTYMTAAVHDNAKLILGAREDLSWQSWRDQPIRGIAEPMDVVGLGQRPYHAITPPRGFKPLPEAPPSVPVGRRTLVLSIIVLAGILAIAGAHQVRQWWAVSHRPAPPPPPAPAPARQLDELPPLVAIAPAFTPPDAPPVPEGSTLPAEPANADGSAENTPLLPPPPAWTPPDGADLAAFQPELMAPAELIEMAVEHAAMTATLIAFRGQDALVIACGVPRAGEQARMDLYLDGDSDEKLETQRVTPPVDLILHLSAAAGETPAVSCSAVNDGQPGVELMLPAGMAGRRVAGPEDDIWLFRLPYKQLHLSLRKYARFTLVYRADAPDKAAAIYPGPRFRARRLEIPQDIGGA